MALQLIGAGFGRTGTMSTYVALNRLGLPCYHMIEVVRNKANKDHLDFWRRVANGPAGAQHDWERVFAGYAAAIDNPACCVWRELAQAYPDAKVLLTLHPRGADAWFESTIDTIYFTETAWQFKVLALFTPFGRKFGDMSRKLIWQRSHRGTMPDRAAAVAHYNRHIEEVKAAVPADRLLVFSVDQGWAPLCEFLGVPVPDEPFPNVNDRAEIKKALRGMTRGAYVILAGLAVAAAAVAYGIYSLVA
ncbi:MAG: sulfotransferase [Alphaproteobacteria bacterium]